MLYVDEAIRQVWKLSSSFVGLNGSCVEHLTTHSVQHDRA